MKRLTKLDILMDNVKIDPDSECWIYINGLRPDGYYRIRFRGGMKYAHRVFYTLIKGEILDDDLQLDHLCRNRACVNPKHLELVTPKENVLRSSSAIRDKKTHCPAGHKYSTTNTYITPEGYKYCRECHKLHQRRYMEKNEK